MIAVAAGDNVVRLLPPLIITEAEISEGIRRLDRACARLNKLHGGAVKEQAAQ
jgi:acetylornithine/N-succinyldiaminopimelate aminotransferase